MSEGEDVAIGAGVVHAAARITRRKMIFFIRTILAQLEMGILSGGSKWSGYYQKGMWRYQPHPIIY
jgi:hypothetical protein